jgi:polar amino acid transport system substrate-binding protein
MMTKRLWSALALAALCLMQTAHAGPTLERIKKKNVLVEAVSESYPPFSFLNDKNQMDGFDVEVAREVAKRLGVPLKVETPSWEVLSAGAWRGRWDICVCSMTPDRQRAQVLDFVAPYYNSPAVLVTSANNDVAKTVRDFNGKRIGAEQASSYERYLKRELVIEAPDAKPLVYPFETVHVAPYGNEDLAFQDLALGAGKRIDAVLSNYVTAKVRMDKTPGKFKLVGEPLYSEPNWIAVDKSGDAEWKAQIVKIVRDMKSDGTLTRLSQKWIGRDITP